MLSSEQMNSFDVLSPDTPPYANRVRHYGVLDSPAVGARNYPISHMSIVRF